MKKKLLAILACLLLFSSCGYMPTGSMEDLLVAPRLNTMQDKVYKALESTLNLAGIVYRYPQEGQYRSPFIFHDLNGDGRQEAIVFYAYKTDLSNSRCKILSEDSSGEWYSLYDIADLGEQIEFVSFEKLLNIDQSCMVVGWQSGRRSSLGIYSFSSGKVNPELSLPYMEYMLLPGQKQEDGLGKILTISGEESSSFQVTLFGKGAGGHIQQLDTFPLAEGTSHILQVLWGTLWNDMEGVYIDILLDGSITATEIFFISGASIYPVSTQNDGEDFSSTFRYYDLLCMDVDKDGTIDIPQLLELSGQEEAGVELEELLLTRFLHITADGFQPLMSGVLNERDFYFYQFPERWLDKVTVVRQPEIREWQFFTSETEDSSPIELLRLRTYSVDDYRDKFTDNYILLGQNGTLTYYAYIPPGSSQELATTEAEVRQMFWPL